jgi:hypothetical protein
MTLLSMNDLDFYHGTMIHWYSPSLLMIVQLDDGRSFMCRVSRAYFGKIPSEEIAGRIETEGPFVGQRVRIGSLVRDAAALIVRDE